MAQTQTRRAERLEARITRRQKRLLERAAEITGSTLTGFVVSSVQQAAAHVIRDAAELRLRGPASEAFVSALLRPPAPNAALKAAARRYHARTRR